jgi:Cu(I)/Ag(I) efflux system membrane fusion protein
MSLIKAMAIVRWGLVVGAAAAALWTWSPYVLGQRFGGAPAGSQGARIQYRCPMHPQIVSDDPGECPICHMTLQPVAQTSAAPAQVRPSPPPVAADAGAAQPGSVPPGTTSITLTFDRVQSIGVRTALAQEREGPGALRVTATVQASEQGAAEVHVRAAGFVERISVRETGVRIAAGQELFGLYSPEVLQAETELCAAKGFGEAGARSVEAARRRLELLGMPARAIDEVVAKGEPMRVIPVSSPAGGFVSKKSVVLGSYVTPEMALYDVIDLAKVYVVADVFQRDAAGVRIGTEGRFTLAQRPDRAFRGSVDLVYPEIDPQARTTRVRMQLRNEKLELRPGQYGEVELSLAGARAVVVPRDAIVDTGRSTYVFVDEGGGRYTPRVVRVGHEIDEAVEVVAGVSAGDRVVSGATFLVDSESRLQASLTQLGGAGAGPQP